MKVLFVGSVIKTEDCTKYLGPSVAGNKMQIGILKGLKTILQEDLYVLSEIPFAAFPREKKVYIGSENIQLTNDINAKKVPYINFFILKQICLIINAFFMISKWSKKNRNEKKIIICFNAFPCIAIPVIIASKIFYNKTVCIFADPPINVVKRSFIGKIAKYFEDNSTKKNIKKFDGLIVLNEKSIEKYTPESKYILVDGGFDLDDIPKNQPGGQWINIEEDDMVIIVFSGALTEYNGITKMVEAIKLVQSNRLCLEIYGSGPLEHYVKQASKEDNRIRFMGNVTNLEMIKIQQEAGILINPRLVNDPISVYTFPSKMIEYLLSGTPVITTKLNGLSKDYLDNVFVVDDETPLEIAKIIDFVIKQDRDYLVQKATAARDFIIKSKNWKVHSEKINQFLEELIKDVDRGHSI